MKPTKKTKRIRSRSVPPEERVCLFCKKKTVPGWRDYESYGGFLTARGRIQSRLISNVCVRHQRRLAEAIKQARHLGLLPFVTEVRG